MPINYLDRKKVHKSLKCLLAHYPRRAFIASEVESRLLSHLPTDFIAQDALNLLHEQQWLTDNNERLSYKEQTFDLVVANLVPLWVSDLDELFQEAYRLLKPNGIFLISTLGVESFKELKASFALADDSKHIHEFYDMHDIGDRLVANDFAQPVMANEQMSLMYLNLADLITDLTQSGLRNSLVNRKKGLMTQRQWRNMQEYYAITFGKQDELPLTLDVIFGYARKPLYKAQAVTEEGEIEVSLEALQASLAR